MVRLERRGIFVGTVIWLGIWLLAGGLSLARIEVSQSDLSQLLWAEDGLFPLCARKTGFLACFFDPFAGYLLGVPRAVAQFIALAPIEAWGTWTNITAAVLWGSLSPFVFFGLRSIRVSVPSALLVSLAPVLIPAVGLEAVNTTASIYMPLLFTATVMVLVARDRDWTLWTAAILGFLAAITIPLGGWLIALVIIRWVGRRISARSALISGGAIAIALVAQGFVVLTAEYGRSLTFTPDALSGWLDSSPNALLHLWPGINFGPATVFGIFELPVFGWTGIFFVVAILGTAAVALRQGTQIAWFGGLILISGMLYSFIPTVTGYASNRYFILTALCIVAAIFVGGDSLLRTQRRSGLMWVISIATVVIWASAFPASPWRSSPSPNWLDQVTQIQGTCSSNPESSMEVIFSPDWPQPGTTELHAPTDAVATCVELNPK